jgi:hypothetical protein
VTVGETLCVPLVAFVPLQLPLAVQEVALVLDHVSVEMPPEVIVIGLAESVTVGVEAVEEVTVAVAVALLVESATEIAFIVTEAGDGTAAGAVYRPAAEIVPLVALPPATPFTCQVTPLFCESFETVAVNCCVCPVFTLAVAGVTLTEMASAVNIIVALAVFAVLACAIAVIVTVELLGITEGAVYIPDAEIVPWVLSPAVTPLICQVTAVLVALVTVAENG